MRKTITDTDKQLSHIIIRIDGKNQMCRNIPSSVPVLSLFSPLKVKRCTRLNGKRIYFISTTSVNCDALKFYSRHDMMLEMNNKQC